MAVTALTIEEKAKSLVTAFYELAIKPEKTKRGSAMHLKINGLLSQ
jgi:hypothetical protein